MAKSREKASFIPDGEMAHMLDLSRERLRELAAEGWFPRSVNGRYLLTETVQGYIKFLRDEERRSSRSKPAADLQAARQREVELRIAEREARLIDTEDAEAAAAYMIAVARETFVELGKL